MNKNIEKRAAKSPHRKGMRQRVALLDPAQRSREHARRAIRALGHSPLVFASLAEMLELGEGVRDLAIVFVGAPFHRDESRSIEKIVRSIMGYDVPVVPAAFGSRLFDDGIGNSNGTLSFGELYRSLAWLMQCHRMPTLQKGLTWGGLRFLPATGTVQLEGREVALQPREFDLAMEFFHNVNRTLPRAWLRSMVAPAETEDDPIWLDRRVASLRRLLDLSPAHGWNLQAVASHGYRLDSMAVTQSKRPFDPSAHNKESHEPEHTA